MRGAERCDEIARLIDKALAEVADIAAPEPSGRSRAPERGIRQPVASAVTS